MPTAREVIKRAFSKAGIIYKTEVLDADEYEDALDSLNDMIQDWANDSPLVYSKSWESFTLTGNQGLYTIGSGGDFNTVRPVKILSAFIRSGGTDYPVSSITGQSYYSITDKDSTGIPEWLNYDNSYPLANIRLHPYPAAAYELHLLTEKPVSGDYLLDDQIALPPGWLRALKYNLAMDLASEYQQPVNPQVDRLARMSLASIKRGALKNNPVDSYIGSTQNYNINSGYWD